MRNNPGCRGGGRRWVISAKPRISCSSFIIRTFAAILASLTAVHVPLIEFPKHKLFRDSSQKVAEIAACCNNVGGIQDGRDDADALRAGGADLADIIQIDATDGEPRNLHVRG